MSEYTPKEWVKDNMVTNAKLRRLKELIEQIPTGGTIDEALSTESENAVQNKVVTGALNGKEPKTVIYHFEADAEHEGEILCTEEKTVGEIAASCELSPVELMYNNVKYLVQLAGTEGTDSTVIAWGLNVMNTSTPKLGYIVGINDTNITNKWLYAEIEIASKTYVTQQINNAITSAINANY